MRYAALAVLLVILWPFARVVAMPVTLYAPDLHRVWGTVALVVLVGAVAWWMRQSARLDRHTKIA